MADEFTDGEKGNSLGIAESRTHSRAPMHSLAYIELSDDNGGLILNISEDGLAVQAVQVVSAEQLSRMRFRLPKTSVSIEATGKLVWQLRSKKEAGIQFVDIPKEARETIRQWIGMEASSLASAAEAPQSQVEQSDAASIPVPPLSAPPQMAPQSPSRVNAQQAAAASPIAQAPAVPSSPAQISAAARTRRPAAATSRIAKPKEPPVPPPEPAIGSQRFPMPPSPAPPAVPGPEFASSLPSSLKPGANAVTPAIELEGPGSTIPPSTPPSAGSAFPAGRIPFRTVPPEPPPVQSPFRGGVANMPSWNGGVAPGLGMRYRKPRRWWTYTAALGIIAAVGFAGLMMIDPSTISRARLATATHEPDPTVNVPQAGAASTSIPSTNTQPSVPAANDSAVNPNAQAPQQTPQTPTATNNASRQSSGQASGPLPGRSSGGANPAAGDNGTAQANPIAPVNPIRPPDSASGSQIRRDESTKSEASAAEESARLKREERAREEAAAEQAANNAGSSSRVAQPSQTAPAVPAQTAPATTSASNLNQQPSAPAAAAPINPPVTSPVQPSTSQKDQDDYARTARKEQQVSGTPPARAPAPSTANQGSSVVMSGESSPVPPSVPLVGVPSGSVGATSQFHAIRIPAELQSKAAQLAGNLQIGQMLSSYSPSYPVEAARAGVEGIVKLDVMVAPNGNVESVKILSGPAILTGVSVSAVKGWHYGETLLGGQPIEAEQYVTLVFRLAK